MSSPAANPDPLDALASHVCRCGRKKTTQGMVPFCRRCYDRLSPAMRDVVHRKVGHGFEEAYAQACQELEEAPR